jgi:hypothetical protein
MLVVIIALAALDCAWLRALMIGMRSLCGMREPGFDVGVLAMGNVVLIGLYLIVSGRHWASPFRRGFVVGGLVPLLVYLACGRWFPRALMGLYIPTLLAFRNWVGRPALFFELVVVATVSLVLQLLVAMSGGWLASRIANRRGRSKVAPSEL